MYYFEDDDIVGGTSDGEFGTNFPPFMTGVIVTVTLFLLFGPPWCSDTVQCDDREEYSWVYVQTLDKYMFQKTIIYCDEFDVLGNPKVDEHYYEGGNRWTTNLRYAYIIPLDKLKIHMWRRGFHDNYKIDTLQ